MEERKKNLCAMIPESLHKKVREEQEEWGIKLNEYMERILKDHFEKGEREMANGTRTLAFQVSEEFFQRLKKYLKKTGQSQKEFVIGLIEDVLSQEEHVVSGEMQETRQNLRKLNKRKDRTYRRQSFIMPAVIIWR